MEFLTYDHKALKETRLRNAELSKGISAAPIRNLVLRLLEPLPKTDLLDFGAGMGELLNLISQTHSFDSLVGADITGRPENLPSHIDWMSLDLNNELPTEGRFDIVICVEVVEHLENPRETFRQIVKLLRPGGTCIVTTPNQESLRSLISLVFDGHYAAFRGLSYPAHITALLALDLQRIALESGLEMLGIHYTDVGSLPKFCGNTWQQVSLGLLKGKRFSDNVAIVARKPQ